MARAVRQAPPPRVDAPRTFAAGRDARAAATGLAPTLAEGQVLAAGDGQVLDDPELRVPVWFEHRDLPGGEAEAGEATVLVGEHGGGGEAREHHAGVALGPVAVAQRLAQPRSSQRALGPGEHSHHPSMIEHQSRTAERGFLAAWRWTGDIGLESYLFRG